jgi:hypothetical protein
LSLAQEDVFKEYVMAENFLSENRVEDAYKIYKEIKPKIQQTDTLYKYVTFYHIVTATELQNRYKMEQDYSKSLEYSLEALQLIKDNKSLFDADFIQREAWMTKNVTASYFGLNKLDEAKKYKDELYSGYKSKTLPSGIDEYFNYDFFRMGDKNIWGYEWFEDLPDDRFSRSFTKVVYYVYSTNPDGTDKDQLYRFHVLMFHQDSKDTKFDYILELHKDNEGNDTRRTLYDYTYTKDIDYIKLRNDVKTVVDAIFANDIKK